MDFLAGVVIVLAFIVFSHALGLHRERALYPMVLLVIALAYVLLAASDDAFGQAMVEAVIASGFLVAAAAGYRGSLWWIVIALISHAAFDVAHAMLWPTAAIPDWYAGFCIAADGALALHLSFLLVTRRVVARARGAELRGEPGGPTKASGAG